MHVGNLHYSDVGSQEHDESQKSMHPCRPQRNNSHDKHSPNPNGPGASVIAIVQCVVRFFLVY